MDDDKAVREPEIVSREALLWYEMAAVIFFFIAPDFLAARINSHAIPLSFGVYGAIARSLTALGSLTILLFVTWMSGDKLSAFGVRRPVVVRDISLGIVLAGMLYFVQRIPFWGVDVAGIGPMLRQRIYGGRPGLVVETVFAIIVMASLEEFLFRGYLIRRIGEITNRTWLAVVISTILFGLGHMYQLWSGMPRDMYAVTLISPYLSGLIFAVAFVRTGSLWPCLIGHILINVSVAFWI